MTTTIQKTEAIVLRVASFSRTSEVVTWLTPGEGRLGTVIKGACRPKSPFLGQYDLFQTCELLYYDRDRNGLHIAKECAPLLPRITLRADWRAACLASYISDLTNRATLGASPDPHAYRLLAATLDAADQGGASMALLFWFELKLLGVLGIDLRVAECCLCGRGIPPSDTAETFSPAHGGVVCAGCLPRATGRVLSLPPAQLATLRRWHLSPSPRLLRRPGPLPQDPLEFIELFGMFIQHHLDINLPSRPIALRLLAAQRNVEP